MQMTRCMMMDRMYQALEVEDGGVIGAITMLTPTFSSIEAFRSGD